MTELLFSKSASSYQEKRSGFDRRKSDRQGFRPWVTWSLFVLLFGYNIVDAVQTKQLLLTGLAHEANPFMAWLIESTGSMDSILYLKILVFLVIGFLMHRTQQTAKSFDRRQN